MTIYREKLDKLGREGMLRSLHPLFGRKAQHVMSGERSLINLSSNDYLGLAADNHLLQEFYGNKCEDTQTDSYGLGVASSRLLTGDSPVAHRLEHLLATLYGSESALLFNSGYHANIGILPALIGKKDLVLSDKLNHASIHDGLRIGRADYKRYQHCDYEQLRSLLEQYRHRYTTVLIASESIFSMDGDCADLARLVALKKQYDCMLYLDEAHAIGLYGKCGLGIAEQEGLVSQVDFLVGTFGKACGSIGAFLICSHDIREYLINHSRSLIFTTALPPVVLSWNHFVMGRIPAMTDKRDHLQQLSTRLRGELAAARLKTGGTTNIIPVIVGSSVQAVKGARYLQEQGFLVMPVRPPTVPEGTSRYRLSLTADMAWQQIARVPELIRGHLLNSETP